MQYDIFISYRRSGGEDKARLVNKKLKEMGYKVFFDHDAALRGQFETVIKTAIENSKVVLLVLSSRCFDRCADSDDFVRKEIEHAQGNGINIIPLFPKGDIGEYEELFSGKNLPQSIASLQKQECATVDFHENFEATCEFQIRKVLPHDVYPQNKAAEAETCGADIYVLADMPCIVYSYGRRIGVAQKNDGLYGSVLRLRKGRHRLRFESVDDDDVFVELDYSVPDNEYVDYVEVSLEGAKREAEEKKALETERYRQYVICKRRELKETRNYIVVYVRSASRFARGVCQLLGQIGNRCICRPLQELADVDDVLGCIDDTYGEAKVLVLIDNGFDLERLKLVVNAMPAGNIALVLLGNVMLPDCLEQMPQIKIAEPFDCNSVMFGVCDQVETQAGGTACKQAEVKSVPVQLGGAALCMQYVEGGRYRMGDTNFSVETEVDSFYLARTTVTNRMWQIFMGGNVSFGREDCPVTGKTIGEMREFVSRLNKYKAGEGIEFYIPSEEQWEYAAREGVKSRGYIYSGSNVLDTVAWHKGNMAHNGSARNVYAEGSSKHDNALGLYFMSGNVWEVCAEYGTHGEQYVVRGGSYRSGEEDCRVYSRAKFNLDKGCKYVGLRLACRRCAADTDMRR